MQDLFISILFALLLSACTAEPQFEQAKNFTLLDAASETFSLSDYQGKGVVVIFWASWCPYCAKVTPSLEKYYRQYQPQGLEIIAVNIMEDGDPVAHMKDKGFSYRLGLYP